MLSTGDCVFELALVQQDLATESQVSKGVKEVLARQERGESSSLAEVLVEQGSISESVADEARKRSAEDILPGYRFHEELGRGGMGVVYRATQVSMERDVAIKILSRRLSTDSKFCKKFLQEARNAAKLNHENIMGGIDCGEADGLHFFVMEYVDGESLVDIIDREGPLAPDRAYSIVEQVARGLKNAHGQKIVHRDIKPENLMLTSDGVVKICDFGLARPERKAGEGMKGATCEGTPDYCAPEQALGHTDLDARCDIYALGTSLYHLLTGRPPYTGKTARKLLWHQVNTPFPDIRETLPELDPARIRLLEDMVAKDRNKRLASATVLLERLARLREVTAAPRGRSLASSLPAGGGPPVAILGVLVGLLAFGAFGIAMSLDQSSRDPDVSHSSTAGETGGATTAGETGAGETGGDSGGATGGATGGGSESGTTAGAGGTGGSGPVLVRVGKDPIKTPGSTGGDSGTGGGAVKPVEPVKPVSVEERQARALLARAKEHEASHPGKLEISIARYREVVEKYPGSKAGKAAQNSLQRLMKLARKALEGELRETVKKARTLRDQGLFRDALATLESFRESHDAGVLKPMDGTFKSFRDQTMTQARRELSGLAVGLRDWAKAARNAVSPLLDGLDAFARRAPLELEKDIKALRAEVLTTAKSAKARARFEAIRENVRKLLARGSIADAVKLLDASLRDPELAGMQDKIKVERDNLAAVAVVWEHFEKGMAALADQVDYWPLRDEADPLKGSLRDYTPGSIELQIKIYGRKAHRTIELGDLKTDYLLGLLPPMKDATTALSTIRFFMAKGLIGPALDSFKKAKTLGVDDPALEKELTETLAKMRETAAARLVARLATLEPGEEVVAICLRLSRQLSKTKAWRENRDRIVEAYTKSRAVQLIAGDAERLFRATKCQRVSQKELKFRFLYKFEDKAELEDWAVEKGTLKNSEIKIDKGAATITGKIRFKPRFLGGSLKIDAELTPTLRRRPNINMFLSDQGGRNGLFVGVMSRMNARDVTISDNAPRKQGVKVRLPANVVADVRDNTWDYVYAERKPQILTDRPCRYSLDRGRRGTLTGRLNGRTVISLPRAPRADETGAIGFYLDKVSLVLDSFAVEGIVEDAWMIQRAEEISKEEAAKFPPAIPPGKDGKAPQNKKDAKKDDKKDDKKDKKAKAAKKADKPAKAPGAADKPVVAGPRGAPEARRRKPGGRSGDALRDTPGDEAEHGAPSEQAGRDRSESAPTKPKREADGELSRTRSLH